MNKAKEHGNKFNLYIFIFIVIAFLWIFVRPVITKAYCWNNAVKYKQEYKETTYYRCLLRWGIISLNDLDK